ncbi:autotransporter outer membrane beta-barrel domain-containing protein [Bradyrhizobium prioriisuperbiae]|uniref:autotransporter outer membrane beta-barrel domain-containing protein n=1 Tax=Bradyrhizobium prioriisuperbiae TaxID=2854389 RepID=UPI0028E8221D|nr:autotransporter domain-containing protein [Bradyrhizobium prioritasuperba]
MTCSDADTDGVGTGAENHVTVTVNSGATIVPYVALFGIDLTYRNVITNDGSVTGFVGGISVTNRNTIVNNGTIGDAATSVGITMGNRNTVTNNGTITSGGLAIFGQDRNTIVNNGTIEAGDGFAGILLNSRGTVTNNGSINVGVGSAGIALGDRGNVVNNGQIVAGETGVGIALATLNGGSIVNNNKIQAGNDGIGLLLQGTATVLNNGTISVGNSSGGGFPPVAAVAASGDMAITNNGLITAGDNAAGVFLQGSGSLINNGTIQAGALGSSVVAGGFLGPLTITNNGKLDGTISVSGIVPDTALINNGTITITNPNTPLDKLTDPFFAPLTWHFIDSTFTQTAGGTLELRVNRDGQSDGLGSADPHLGGTLRAVLQPGLYDKVTTYYSVVYNCGCIGGDLNGTTFDKVVVNSASPFFSITANYVNNPLIGSGINAVDLVLTRQAFGAVPGETQNQRAVGTALEQGYSTALTGGLATFYTNLLFATNSVAVLDQLSGEGTIATQNTSFLATTLFVKAMMGETSWGFAAPGTSSGPLGFAPQRREHPAFKALVKAPETDDPTRWRFSAGGFGGSLTTKGNADVGSANQVQSGGAGIASLSYRVDPQLLVGGALSGGRFSFSSAPRATTGDIDAFQAGLFARRDWNTFRVTAALNGAVFDNSTSRFISGIGATEQARASFTSNLIGGRVEIARPYAFEGLNVTPFAAIQPATLWQRARTESSVVVGTGLPGMLGLAYAPVTVTSLPSFLGVQFDTSFDLGAGRLLTPVLRAAWVHEFRPDRSQDASFLAIPGPNFTVFGPRVASDAVQLDAGLQLALNSSTTLQANFSSELSGSSSRYSGSGALRLAW